IFSICFPICHQLGTKVEAGKIGKRMSRVYAANIIGSVAGPLLVNFAILQFATTQLAFAILGMLGVAAGTVLVSFAEARRSLRMVCAACCVIGIASLLASFRSGNWLINSLADPGNISLAVETSQSSIIAYKEEGWGDPI